MAKSKIKSQKSEVGSHKLVRRKAEIKGKKTTESIFKQHVTRLKADDKAPYFEGPDQDGRLVSLDDFAGKTLILYFYPKDDTPTCTTESCSLRDEYKFLTKQNYAVVGVSADSVKSHKKFAAKFSLPFPLIADEDMKIIKSYDVWGQKMLFGRVYDGIVRTTFIIEKGKILRVISDVDSAGHGKQVLEA